jgi:hypothetical protein
MNKYFRLLTMLVCALCIGVYFACSSGSDDKDGGNGGGNNNGGGGSSQQTSGGIFACLNPTDPTFITMTNAKGEEAVLSGTKTSAGMPNKLEQIVVKNADETEYTQMYLNDDQLLKQVIAPNGVQMLFEWISKTKAAVTLIDPNTNEQLNTVVDFENPSSAPAPNMNALMRRGKSSMTIEPTRIEEVSSEGTIMHRAGNTGDIYVEECDYAQANVEVLVEVYAWTEVNGFGNKGKWKCNIKCKNVGKGHYEFTVPSEEYEHTDFTGFAGKINDIINEICDKNSYLLPGSGFKEAVCIAVSGAIAAAGLGISAPVAAGFLKACTALSISVDTMCGLVNGNLDIPAGMPSLATQLIEIMKEEEFKWNRLYMRPFVNAIPKCKYGDAQVLIDGQTFKTTTINMGGSPTIAAFSLNPSAPGHGVSYTATAVMGCLPEGSKVTMSIVGTDGYTDTQTSTVPADGTKSYTAKLHVPGAATGVKDICTVNVTLPDGNMLEKKASLVFQ